MIWMELLVLFAVSAVVTIALVPFAKRISLKLDAIDYPSARRVNMLPIPRLGGVAMMGGALAAFAVMYLGIAFWGWSNPFNFLTVSSINFWGVALGVAVVFITGVIDDIKHLSPKEKLVGQIVAACIVAGSGLLISSMRDPFSGGYIDFGLWAYPLTVFYLVAFANIINLIDGLDGLASGITALAAGTILISTMMDSRTYATILAVIVIGVCIGFLRYNFNPASIFMGDSGALTLGFGLGVISLLAVSRSMVIVSLAVPLIAAGVPIIDTAFAIIRRVKGHRPIDEADKGHIHHQLMNAGFSQRTTVLIMWAWTAGLAACALLIVYLPVVWRLPLIIVVVVASAIIIGKLNLLGLTLAHHFHPRGRYRKDSSRNTSRKGATDKKRAAADDQDAGNHKSATPPTASGAEAQSDTESQIDTQTPLDPDSQPDTQPTTKP